MEHGGAIEVLSATDLTRTAFPNRIIRRSLIARTSFLSFSDLALRPTLLPEGLADQAVGNANHIFDGRART